MTLLNHNQFKYIINASCLFLSTALIINFLLQLVANNILIQIVIIFFAVILELLMQYALGLGRSLIKRKTSGGWWKVFGNKSGALLLFLFYAVYVLVYAIPSAIGFFSAEIDLKEQAFNKGEVIQNANRDELNQISATIASLNKQFETEAATGYGSRSKEVMKEYRRLSERRQELLKSFENVSETKSNVPTNAFMSLGKTFNTSENIFKVLIFGVSVAMIYLGLILTSWNVSIREQEVAATKEVNQELLDYIEALYPEDGLRRLTGDPRISAKTGIPLERCVKYREQVSKMKIKGQPVMVTVQGGSTYNVPKEVLIKYVKEHC